MSTTLLVPTQLSAFVLNQAVCNSSNSKISPITQPNYTFLRLSNSLILPDVQDHVDLHTATPDYLNPRITDLGTGKLRRSRVGVYLHWTLPRVYRTGSSAVASSMQTAPATPGGPTTTDPNIQAARKLTQGYPSNTNSGQNFSAPDFRPIPNRWLLVRRITDMTKVRPAEAVSTAPNDGGLREFEAWVIDSDHLWNINQFDNPINGDPVDIEVDASPFINPADLNPTNGQIIDGQAEIFIGRKTRADKWSQKEADAAPCVRPLTVLTSSNPLFADYQPHNANVLSMCDNFKYTKVVNNDGGATKYADFVNADYTLIGWHSLADDDCMTTDPKKVTTPTLSQRLQDCLMTFKDGGSDKSKGILSTADANTRLLCHSTMYGVTFDSGHAPPTVLADNDGQTLATAQPIALGVSPLDSLMALVNAHVQPRKTGDPLPADMITEIEQDLLSLQTLLQKTDSDVDGQSAALDEMYAQAFTKLDGGTVWNYSNISSDGKPVVPDPDHLNAIRSLNKSQKVLDTANRELQELRWRLFAEWWNYVSVLNQPTFLDTHQIPDTTPSNNLGDLPQRLIALNKRIQFFQGMLDAKTKLPKGDGIVSALTADVTTGITSAGKNAEKGTDERFYQRKDPTLLFGGIKSAWQSDFLQPLPVRGDWQLIVKSADPVAKDPPTEKWKDRYQAYINSLVDGLSLPTAQLTSAAKGVMMELWHLRPTSSTSLALNTTDNPNGVIPFFHDETALPESRGRDRWQDQQPWFPLFVEWEAVFYNIPFKYWSLKERPRHSDGQKVVQYDVDVDFTGSQPPKVDSRTVSGRVLVLPQPTYQLSNNMTTVLNNTNASILEDAGINDQEKTTIKDKIGLLDFISAPLTGLTSQLLTLHEGSHLKPTVRAPNSGPIVIQAALDAATPGKFTLDMMEQMDTETTSTPFGNSAAVSQSGSPLKLVTHGQLMFTKINIIDKFGQAICAIPNTPQLLDPDVPLPTVFPCLSDSLFPGTVGNPARINSVVKVNDPKACCVARLTPSLNSPARINGYFVTRDTTNTTAPWRPCDEWENPIWGWVVVNYADYGLQFFLNDGTFYREVRIGGPGGTVAEPRWLPFNPPRVLAPNLQRTATQLDFLIDQLTAEANTNYMFAFFDMINQSVEDNSTAAPNSYAGFLPAIVGKPLALVNTGWSIEVSGIERQNWSVLNSSKPDIGVVEKGSTNKVYEFPVKFGDAVRSFDGVVGYFPAVSNDFTPGGIADPPPTPPAPSQKPISDLHLDQLLTYFTKTSSSTQNSTLPPGDPRIAIGPTTYQKMRPYYYLPYPSFQSKDASDINDTHNSKLKVFGMLVDPYTPIHAYSGILPNKSLTLPQWSVESAMKKMSAFFHMGPIVLTADVPRAYDTTHPLTGEYNLVDNATTANSIHVAAGQSQTVVPPPPPTVAIPISGAANWNWLQPYRLSEGTRYNAIGLDGRGTGSGGAAAGNIRLDPAPYTAVEGFLQLVKPLMNSSDLKNGTVNM